MLLDTSGMFALLHAPNRFTRKPINFIKLRAFG